MIDYRKIEDVKPNEFMYQGEKWMLADIPKNQGFSAKGIYNLMTNGKITVMVYKADILKVDRQKAIALFN